MKEVKNISDQDLSLEGIGMVKKGETVKVPDGFSNANFEEVSKKVGELKNKKDNVEKDDVDKK